MQYTVTSRFQGELSPCVDGCLIITKISDLGTQYIRRLQWLNLINIAPVGMESDPYLVYFIDIADVVDIVKIGPRDCIRDV